VAEATTFSILTMGLVWGILGWLYKGQYIYLFGRLVSRDKTQGLFVKEIDSVQKKVFPV
jgi:hypothetical protein